MKTILTSENRPLRSFDREGIELLAKLAEDKKVSAIIRLALQDMQRLRVLPDYKIDMSEWMCRYSHYGKEMCAVCFAGCLMAGTAGMDLKNDHDLSPSHALLCIPESAVSEAVRLAAGSAFRMLNSVRMHDWQGAGRQLKIDYIPESVDRQLCALKFNGENSNDDDLDVFIAQMNKAADIFEKAGY